MSINHFRKSSIVKSLCFCFVFLMLIHPAFANYNLSKKTVSSAGKSVNSENYGFNNTLGQPSIIGDGNSANYNFNHGFWSPAGGDFVPDATLNAGLAGAANGKGLAWGDYDQDGDWDFFVSRDGQDYLYINNGNGTFTEDAISHGLIDATPGTGASWADYNGDGKLDLFLQNAPGYSGLLWKQADSSFFEDWTTSASLNNSDLGTAACWGDFDGDGFPDLFMAHHSDDKPHLYRNNGDGKFYEVAEESALNQNTRGIGTWGDYNNDGNLDLFIAQDNGESDILYKNEGDGSFSDVSLASGIADINSGKGPAWGDYNNDGWLDLFIPNAGTENDIIYKNNADGTFDDVTVAAGIDDAMDGLSASWGDVNNDGYLDLYVTNGSSQQDILYYNMGDGSFLKTLTGGAKSSYGSAWSDYDKDGDIDLLVTRPEDNFSLYRNDRDNGKTLKVRVLDSYGHFTCFGAQVRLYDSITSSLVAMRQVDGGHGAGCQDMYDAHFGVDPDNRYDIEVRFMRKDGGEQIILNAANTPGLGDVIPRYVDLGYVEVLENGRVRINTGIAYVCDSAGNNNICLLNREGANLRQLTYDFADDRDPSWSPDANKIVFASDRDSDWDLYVIGLDGKPPVRLSDDAFNNTQPAWSTDGTKIAFASDRDTDQEIYLVDTAGKNARNLTESPSSNDKYPSWSPNSGKIVFVSDRDGNENIYVMNFDGSNQDPLTDNGSQDTQPVYSPDGLQIAFTSYRDGNAEIFVMNFDGEIEGSAALNISNNGAEDCHPAWTPDGQEIVFQSDRDGEMELYICKADGGNVRKLTSNASFDGMPNYPMAFRYPPKSIVFGVKNGRTTYWADPVNTELGNYTYSKTDFTLLGRGLPLQFARFYNSMDPLDGPLGFGWRHSYMIEVMEGVDGDITLTWGDGRQDFYRLLSTGEYIHWDGVTEGTMVKSAGSFSFQKSDGTSYAFDSQGRCVSITDQNGESILLSYTGDDLTGISQSNGRDLALSYSSDHLTMVTDHTGRSVEYTYDASGNLETFTNSRGKTWTFSYDVNHRLLTITDPLSNVMVTNQYDDSGKVWKQWDALSHLTRYDYDEIDHKTTIVDRAGKTRVHKYDNYRRLKSITDPEGEIVQYGYDSNGNRSYAVDSLGNATRYPTNPEGLPTGIEDPLGNASEIEYDPSTGNPVSRKDELGREMSYAYDAKGNLEKVTNPLGDYAATQYNSFGKPVLLTDEMGTTTTLEYNFTGDLVRIIDALGCETVLGYDALGRMTSLTNPEGHSVTYSYNENNCLETVTDERGGQAIFSYDDADRLITVSTKLNTTENAEINYEYDPVGRIIRKTGPRGNDTIYDYDAEGRLLRVTDSLSGFSEFTYDSKGQLTKMTDAVGSVSRFEYDSNGRLAKQTDPRGNVTTYQYDACGRLITVTDPAGRSVEYEYDEAGQRTKSTDRKSSYTQTKYDELGRIEKLTDELGNTVTYQYDKVGNVRFTTDEKGKVTEYQYDAVYNLERVIDSEGNETLYAYDGNNRLKTVTDPEGNATTFVYDETGNLIEIKDPEENSVLYDYDLAGRLIKITDQTEKSESYEYDLAGNRISLTDRNGFTAQWTYDELGRLISATDGEGNSTSYEYDAAGRLTKTTDAEGQMVLYDYDANWNLTKITTPRGYSTTRAYDELNRLISVTDPLGRQKSYEYDAVGNLIRFIMEDGQFIKYHYDAADRLVKTEYPDGTEANYVYDEAGNLLSVSDVNGVTNYAYDSLGRLVSYTDAFGKTVGYEYNRNGRVSTIIYPGGKRVEYDYDSLGRMWKVTDWLGNTTTYTYDARGSLISALNANGTRTLYDYDDDQRLISLRNEKSDASLIAEYDYVRDKVGNIIEETRDEPVKPFMNTESKAYDYDEADQISNAGDAHFTHDARGNIISHTLDQPTSYTFDYANRLVEVTRPDITSTYLYDDAGNRLESTHNGQTTRYTLDVNRGLVSVLSENDASNSEEAWYVYGLGLISRITDNGDVNTYHYNQVGSTVALTNDAGGVTDAYSYDAFGKTLNQLGSNDQPYQYVGQYGVTEEGNGLLFMRARYYNECLERFVSTDPIWDTNLFYYSRNNPVGVIDPGGEYYDTVADIGLYTLSTAANYYAWEHADSNWEKAYIGLTQTLDTFLLVAQIIDPTGVLTGAKYLKDASKIRNYMSVAETSMTAMDFLFGDNDDPDREKWTERQGTYVPPQARPRKEFNAIEIDVFSDSTFFSPLLHSLVDLAGSRKVNQKTLYNICDWAGLNGTQSQSLNTGMSIADPSDFYSNSTTPNGDDLNPYDPLLEEEKRQRELERRQRNQRRREMRRIIREKQLRQQKVMGQINALTSGRGLEAMSGRYGLSYDTVSLMGSEHRFLTGFWYTNVSRCVQRYTPKPDISPWLAAHAEARRAARERVTGQFGPSGFNTPWLPEIFEAYAIDGKFAIYGK